MNIIRNNNIFLRLYRMDIVAYRKSPAIFDDDDDDNSNNIDCSSTSKPIPIRYMPVSTNCTRSRIRVIYLCILAKDKG